MEVKTLESNEIMKILPHRPPLLMVDRVTSLTPGEKITAVKNISSNEPWLSGHFPGRPVLPGVAAIEAMAQAGALLVHATEPFDGTTQPLLLLGIDRARFRRSVFPGDKLVIECAITSRKRNVWRLRTRARVGDELAAEATILASVGEAME